MATLIDDDTWINKIFPPRSPMDDLLRWFECYFNTNTRLEKFRFSRDVARYQLVFDYIVDDLPQRYRFSGSEEKDAVGLRLKIHELIKGRLKYRKPKQND